MDETLNQIEPEHLDNMFSALSADTRKKVITEVFKAQLDTSMEYHREHSREGQLRLYTEIKSLNTMLSSLRKVDKEYDEIVKAADPSNYVS